MAESEQDIQRRHDQEAALLALGFYWSPERYAYISSSGEVIPATTIRFWVDQALANAKQYATGLTQQFIDGQITYESWITQLRAELKAMHAGLAQVAVGGTENFGPVEAGALGARLKSEYSYLTNLGLEIENGQQALDGSLLNRVGLFVESGRGTFEAIRREMMVTEGFDQEMRILEIGPNHCGDCPDVAGFWAPAGTLPDIGSLQCLSNCACVFIFQNSQTGLEA